MLRTSQVIGGPLAALLPSTMPLTNPTEMLPPSDAESAGPRTKISLLVTKSILRGSVWYDEANEGEGERQRKKQNRRKRKKLSLSLFLLFFLSHPFASAIFHASFSAMALERL
jgi:hypothetical protein